MGLFGRERKHGRHAGEPPGNTGGATVAPQTPAPTPVPPTTVPPTTAAGAVSLPATAQHLLAMGASATKARVESVTVTGYVVGQDPVVDLLVSVEPGRGRRPVPLRTVVPRITVPRQGETVVLVTDPTTGAYLYAGLSL
ncbi:hypothetical protein [Actinokineospora diospyrosa]|uniref:Uncharacterized protein n=1 Tax=Actinokineospora diospyrosa TaxID=103728 RepID=A0ABT1IFL6_9PSEU|nr:hypothetical protein [Actinokineospora diospyrosa]MCP2271434.1 hypothetical protein [Actinokineospora diospyrosa]